MSNSKGMKAEREAEEFNQRVPVGTSVNWRSTTDAAPKVCTTRSKAWVVGDHASVQVEGVSGSVPLTHVDLIDEAVG